MLAVVRYLKKNREIMQCFEFFLNTFLILNLALVFYGEIHTSTSRNDFAPDL